MRHFVIGDVHGCYNTLLGLINIIPFEKGDKFVFVGDYIDRGNFSKDVVDYVRSLVDAGDAIALKGNHEDMAYDFYVTHYMDQITWLRNGGINTIKSYFPDIEEINYYDTDSYRLDEDDIEWFGSLPTTYETDNFFICHAGVDPVVPLDEQSSMDLLWIRTPFLSTQRKFDKVIVHGHTLFREVKIDFNKIGIDTGCVYDYKLSCVCLESMRVYERKVDQRDIAKV